MTMTIRLILLSILGLLLHFVMHWWAAWKVQGRIGPRAFLMQEPPRWIAAVLGMLACMLMLRGLLLILGITPDMETLPIVEVLLQAMAFTVGYMGSSIAAKIPNALGKKSATPEFFGNDQKPGQ